MSMRLVVRVLKTPMTSKTDKLVLMALAEAGHDDGGSCYPGVARLAQLSGVTERNVQLALRRLEAAGWISVVAHARQHRPTEYLIAVARLNRLSETSGVDRDTPDDRPEVSIPTPLKAPEVSVATPLRPRSPTPGVSVETPGVSLPTPDPTEPKKNRYYEEDRSLALRAEAETRRRSVRSSRR